MKLRMVSVLLLAGVCLLSGCALLVVRRSHCGRRCRHIRLVE